MELLPSTLNLIRSVVIAQCCNSIGYFYYKHVIMWTQSVSVKLTFGWCLGVSSSVLTVADLRQLALWQSSSSGDRAERKGGELGVGVICIEEVQFAGILFFDVAEYPLGPLELHGAAWQPFSNSVSAVSCCCSSAGRQTSHTHTHSSDFPDSRAGIWEKAALKIPPYAGQQAWTLCFSFLVLRRVFREFWADLFPAKWPPFAS